MDAKVLKAAVSLKNQKLVPVAIVAPFQRFFTQSIFWLRMVDGHRNFCYIIMVAKLV